LLLLLPLLWLLGVYLLLLLLLLLLLQLRHGLLLLLPGACHTSGQPLPQLQEQKQTIDV
jgi:hypothetical protein